MKKKISIVVPCFNAQETIEKCISALLEQDYSEGYEIVMVDDGSTDDAAKIIKKCKKIKYIFQKNAGPAKARNNGWKKAAGDIVVFTDSDCVPEKDWLKEMIKPFATNFKIGAVGGAYNKTINSNSLLANLIGEEIKFRYRNIGKYTDAHGSYSLAVRREVLKKVGGFDESYPVATAEDWDLCYKIIKVGYKIYFNKAAKVGHHHPTSLIKYLKTQFRHGYYRMKLYRDNPSKASGDKYSGNAKYVVCCSGFSLFFLILSIFYRPLMLSFLILFFALLILNSKLFFYLYKKYGFMFALKDLCLQILRGFAWLFGMSKWILKILFYKGESLKIEKMVI
jgi:cellulose synthase/poly-beta-1,6-N-acetylglucosamine synthase-like glycosyltransferase